MTYALSQQEVVAAYLIGGKHDFLLHVVAPDTAYLRDFALDRITVRPEVINVETALIFDFERNPVIPNFSAGGRQAASSPGRPDHSSRNATTGSTREARLAGK